MSELHKARWFKRLAQVAAVLCMFTGVSLASNIVAVAASECHGDYYTGRDPSVVGVGGVPCASDARTIQSSDIFENGGSLSIGGVSIDLGGQRIGAIELRWSARCGTNWARLNLAQGGNIRQLTVQQDTGFSQATTLLDPLHYWLSPGVYFTNMIYSPVHYCRAYLYKPIFWVSTLWD